MLRVPRSILIIQGLCICYFHNSEGSGRFVTRFAVFFCSCDRSSLSIPSLCFISPSRTFWKDNNPALLARVSLDVIDAVSLYGVLSARIFLDVVDAVSLCAAICGQLAHFNVKLSTSEGDDSITSIPFKVQIRKGLRLSREFITLTYRQKAKAVWTYR